jgi:hypothetical protein
MMTWGQIREAVQIKHPSASFDELQLWMHEAYDAVLLARDWTLLKSQWHYPTPAAYEAGTVAVVQGSSTIDGTGTAWTAEMDKRTIRIGNDPELYQFTFLTATQATLDRPYNGTTAATQTYLLVQRELILPGNMRFLQHVYNPRISSEPITEKTRAELSARPLVVGEPLYYALDLVEGTDPPYQRILIEPVPQTAGEIIISFIRTAVRFNGRNSTQYPEPWVNPWAIIKGAQSLGYPMGSNERNACQIEAGGHLQLMHAEENRRVPATQLKPADRYTRHERMRRLW